MTLTHLAELEPQEPEWFASRPDRDPEPSAWLIAQWWVEDEGGLEASGRGAPAAPIEEALQAWQLEDASLTDELTRAQRALAVAQGRWLELVAEAERRELSMRTASMPTASWLASGTTHSAAAARADVRLAGLLEQHPRVGAALRSGTVSGEQAEVIARVLGKLPEGLDHAQQDAVAAHLVELAAEFNPPALRRLVNHAVAVVAPEVVEEYDRQALDRAERSRRATRALCWKVDPEDGGLRFWGKLPAVEGELVKQHLSAMASSQRAADALMGIETTPAQALADALALTVAHHAGCQGGPVRGGDHTRVVITLDLDTLLAGVGAATLVESDERMSAREARRLACTAGLVPLVLNGDGLPLDLGRSQRLFTPAQRLALAVRDRGCVFPGCDRPPSDCEAHHAVPWWAGGATDVGKGVLLCPHHHHLVELDPAKPDDQNWHVDFDTRGRPRFAAPVRRGAPRLYRQHHRFRI